jgi:dolichol-phosphate mannosyltransferase
MLGQILRFYVVGASGVLVNLALLWLLTEAGLWYIASAVIAIAVSVTTNFIGNKYWTFKSGSSILTQYINFWLASLAGMAIQLSILSILVELVKVWYFISAIIAIAIASLSNFILTKKFVFK